MLHPRLKTATYALLAFLAAISVKIGDGGVIILQLPPLADLIAHIDLYASGLLVLVEVFGRLVPTAKDSSLLNLLVRLADSVLANRATDGGRFVTTPYHQSYGPAV
jgi:hypothetical protein